MTVCGGAESAGQAMTLVKKIKPDVVLIDNNVGDAKGMDLIKKLQG